MDGAWAVRAVVREESKACRMAGWIITDAGCRHSFCNMVRSLIQSPSNPTGPSLRGGSGGMHELSMLDAFDTGDLHLLEH